MDGVENITLPKNVYEFMWLVVHCNMIIYFWYNYEP